MFFFSKLKQKLAKQNFTKLQKSVLAIFSVACFFIFFYPHIASAEIFPTGEQLIVVPILKLALKFTGFLLSLAETIFQWIVNPANMKAVIDNKIIYQIWRTVRDVFNVAFIMVLLFSAFATIFQSAANFNYKKVLLNLVIMALLVNFSYPIARFIIDASNMMMYGFLGKIGGSNSFLTIINESGLDQIFTPTTKEPDTLFLLSAVIFTFIFAITLLIIAVLLVIRTITLAVYVIFSPIAFVGSILPGTALAEAGSKWWKDFMQQCFAGPIMVFMLYVATQMIIAINASKGNMTEIAGLQTVAGQDGFGDTLGKFIASASFFSIPIIILWLGIIKAQESGIHGAKAVVGAGTKLMKNVGMKVSGGQFIKDTHKAYSSRRAKAKEDSWANKLGGNLGSQQDRLRGKIIGGTDAKLRYESDQAAKMKKAGEQNAVATAEDLDLELLATSGNKFERAAATIELAARGLATGAQLNNVRQQFGNDSQVTRQLESKMKASAPEAVFTHNGVLDEAGLTRYMQSDNFNPDKLGADALRNDRVMDIGLRTGALSNDDLEKARKKGPAYTRAIAASLDNAASAPDLQNISGINALRNLETKGSAAWLALDDQLQTATRVQTAHFAQTGTFHAGISSNSANDVATRAYLMQRFNGDTAKRMDTTTTNNAGLMAEFANNLDPSKIKDIINANDGVAQSALFTAIRTNATALANPNAGTRGAKNLARANGDPDLRHRT